MAETVLVVDDEEWDLALIAGILKRGGYNVIAATDGMKAVREHARVNRVDLLITDVAMAPMTGYELADVLTTAQDDLRVLYVSSNVGEEVLRYRKSVSNALFLRKPFTSEALLAKVNQALHRKANRVLTAGG